MKAQFRCLRPKMAEKETLAQAENWSPSNISQQHFQHDSITVPPSSNQIKILFPKGFFGQSTNYREGSGNAAHALSLALRAWLPIKASSAEGAGAFDSGSS